MNIYGIQYDIAWEDRERNFRMIRDLLADANPEPGSWVVLPEMFSTGFSFRVEKVAESEERPSERFLSELARERKIHLVGGVVTRAADGRGLNQALVFGPDGVEWARYSKIHPFSFAGEDKHYASGDRPVVVATPDLRVCPMVCYDLRFPEAFRAATRVGVDLFVVIANWPVDRIGHWETLLQARAIENQAYVLGVNRIGDDPKLHYPGHSLWIDPKGVVLERLVESAGVVRGTVQQDVLRDYRKAFPGLDDIHANLLGDEAMVLERSLDKGSR